MGQWGQSAGQCATHYVNAWMALKYIRDIFKPGAGSDANEMDQRTVLIGVCLLTFCTVKVRQKPFFLEKKKRCDSH